MIHNGDYIHAANNTSFNANITINGDLFLSAGNISSNVPGVAVFNGLVDISGTGQLALNNTASLNGGLNLNGGTLNVNGATTLSGTGIINNTWSSGGVNFGAVGVLTLGVVPGDTTLNMTSGATKTLNLITLDLNILSIKPSLGCYEEPAS